MRIVQVSSAQSLGGAETHVLQLTDALIQRGHDVVAVGRPGGAVKPDVHFPFLNSADLYSAVRLRRFLKRSSFDIVHIHVARDYPIAAAAVLGLNVKLVVTRHLLYPIRRNPLYRRVDGWIATTSQVLKTLMPLRPRSSAVIPNWVDTEKFPFQPHSVHRQMRLGILGQISPHKGHDDAIAALRILGSGYRLLVAGEGSNAYVTGLKAAAVSLAVDFPGFTGPSSFFEQVDMLLVPSWEEPFGIVLLEAMASGIPVIATAAGGPLDIIRSGVDGLLVPPRTPGALAAAIRELSDENRRASIVEQARKRVEAEFDIRPVVTRIEEFYKAL